MTKKARRNDRVAKLTGLEARLGQTRLGAKGISRFGAKRRRKYEFEVLQGTEYSHDGRMALIIRVIDRPGDRYIEIVVEEGSRKVLMYCNEALSAHIGHGSDKPSLRSARKRK